MPRIGPLDAYTFDCGAFGQVPSIIGRSDIRTIAFGHRSWAGVFVDNNWPLGWFTLTAFLDRLQGKKLVSMGSMTHLYRGSSFFVALNVGMRLTRLRLTQTAEVQKHTDLQNSTFTFFNFHQASVV